MISFVLSWLIVRGFKEWQAKLLLGVVAAVFLVMSSAVLKSCYDNNVIQDHEQEIAAKRAEARVKADETAAAERLNDKLDIKDLEEKYEDAIEAQEDSSDLPDSTVAFNCERLRKAGRADGLPACSGH